MIKPFKRIITKYAEGSSTDKEEALVHQYFDKMQEGGVLPEKIDRKIGVKMKRKIQLAIQPTKKSSFIPSYKYQITAAAAAIVLAIMYLLGSFTKDVEYIEQYAAKGEQLQFYLSDSTFVHLNSNSTLIYPKTFDGDSRKVELVGEAFFEVKRTSVTHPFIVKSAKLTTKVLGTKFNVNDSPNETIQVNVYEGKVSVENNLTKEQVFVEKDEQVTWMTETNALQKSTLHQEQFNQWYKGEVKFNQLGIQEVITVLNRRFNTQLYLADTNIPSSTISGDFTSDKIEDILESLQFIYGLQYEKQKDGQTLVHLK